jgi:hypothetical protein
MQFQKATKEQGRLRMALIGPAGSGKTYTALTLAASLGNKVAVIDTERGSASKYADKFDFDVLQLETFAPATYVQAIKAAAEAGYDVLVIDSLSHAWTGKEGALEMVDKSAKRSQSGNTFSAWRDVTPHHNALVDAMLQSDCHIIATMRTKTEYVIETRDGKSVPRKIGMAPIQRDGLEYEFDIVGDMTLDHDLIVTKTRCSTLTDAVVNKPGKEFAGIIKAWLSNGAPAVEKPKPQFVDAVAIEPVAPVVTVTEAPPTGPSLQDLKDNAKLLVSSLKAKGIAYDAPKAPYTVESLTTYNTYLDGLVSQWHATHGG